MTDATLQTIELKAIPSQVVNATLNGQAVTLSVYQKAFGLFMDITLSGTAILVGALCQNLNPVVRSTYIGFVGDLVFYDTEGTSDPDYTGLGSRYLLTYIAPTS